MTDASTTTDAAELLSRRRVDALRASADYRAEQTALRQSDVVGQHDPELSTAFDNHQDERLPASTIIFGAITILLLLWSAWATRELLALKSHRTVSISLATLVGDFVSAEARNGGSPEVTAARTKAYIATIGSAVKAMAEDGNTVLVSEAVLGNSVPDLTPQLKAAVDAQLRSPVQPSPTAGGGNGR